ncbi:hypothetical protein PQJ75_01470 [Rhodoplanes sp. TEM]|uniref:Glycosyltransferase RgtA/B/C/D-like domain-containing protein n=1 Tax=Rhodoplanes tepidamans TaxID=200616 RepID=A0ABT5J9B5_RHOTP|nr:MULTISPECIES: hypothetical protein [Rhodoplanes]MDC7786240.1 hypothetical protein [Rhodoplanes tepidamans]MDC7982389.1 hypothetical protein [Rhodoplanes sp. TEM]MDQ0355039.1 hypothetical protein [Rhodoplanes tepidamans]
MPDAPPLVRRVAVLTGLVWLAVAAQLLVLYWAGTADVLSDTDDAMRLVEVRAFLAGQGWFDLHEPRMNPPAGYDTHWSRLIDAGLAGLYGLVSLATAPALAERLMRTVWPLLWLIPAMAAVLITSARLAGTAALAPAALLLVLGLPAFQQFVPGRIDHHNVQIALAVMVLAAVVASDRRRWGRAAAAGGLTAVALAIGFESLAFLALCGVAPALRFAADRATGPALAAYGLALAAGTAAVFLGTVVPARWLFTQCDALTVNTAAPVVIAGLGLAALGRLAPERRSTRLLGLALLAAVAAALSLAIEPDCRRGPFALMDPAVGPLWLDQVRESQPLLTVARASPAVAATVAAFPLIALAAAGLLLRDPVRRTDFACLTVAAAVAAAGLLTLGNAKFYAYATWFGLPVVAAVLARLAGARPALRVAAAVLVAPAVAGALAAAAVRILAGPGPGDLPAADAAARACLTEASHRTLAALPPGLVVAPIDHGPPILATTPHRVIGGPYHRLSAAILATDRVFRSAPEEARPQLERWAALSPHVYVAVCRAVPVVPTAAPGGLAARLAAGDPPAWLTPVAAVPDEALAIYRFTPDAAAPPP